MVNDMSADAFISLENLAQATSLIKDHGDVRWGGGASCNNCESAISDHNTAPDAHSDIRQAIKDIVIEEGSPSLSDLQTLTDTAVAAIKQHIDQHLCGSGGTPPPPTYPEDAHLSENAHAMVVQAVAAIKPFIDNDNSFTLSISTDNHFSETDPLIDPGTVAAISGLRAQRSIALAVKTSRLLSLDCILNAGDMTHGKLWAPAGVRAFENAVDELISLQKNASAPFYISIGNHDTNSDAGHPPSMRRWQKWWYDNVISTLPNAVTVPDKAYYHVDFPGKKIRLIVLNFADTLNETVSVGTTSRWWGFTGSQLQWLGDVALDLSAKGIDAENWDVIVLSHNCGEIKNSQRKNERQMNALLEGWQIGGSVDIGIGTGYESTYGPFDDSKGFADQSVVDLYAYSYQKNFAARPGGTILACIQGHDHYDFSLMPDKGNTIGTQRSCWTYVSTMAHVPIIAVATGYAFEDGYAAIMTFDRTNGKITTRGICDPNDTRRSLSTKLDLTDPSVYYSNQSLVIPFRQTNILRNVSTVETPVAEPPPGTVTQGSKVVLITATPGATIHYTTDNGKPSTSSAVYDSPMVLSEEKPVTIKAIAAKAGYRISHVAAFHYDVLNSEHFKFTIDTRQTNTATLTTDKTFIIPVNIGFSYHWNIDWGDNTAMETVQGTGGKSSEGIPHEYEEPGTYQITIRPSAQLAEIRGWFGAYAFADTSERVAPFNTWANRYKVVSVDSLITPTMYGEIRASDGRLVFPGTNTAVGYVCYGLCAGCAGWNFNMGKGFGFSPEWNAVKELYGSWSFGYMFQGCSSPVFTMNQTFQIPQNLTYHGGQQAYREMFRDCSGVAFQVNDVFKFPTIYQSQLDTTGNFLSVFNVVLTTSNAASRLQKRTIASIIGTALTPSASKTTFRSSSSTDAAVRDAVGRLRWSDWDAIAANWK